MNIIFVRHIIRFIFLILLQVLVLNNIQISQYINPYLYILFILLLPFKTPPWLLLVSAFLLGLGVDLFSNTIGMHASATVFMAYCRPFVLNLISSEEFDSNEKPTLEYFNMSWIMLYSVLMISIHHLILFFVEVFSFAGFWHTIGRAVVSILFSLTLIVISHYFIYNTKKK